MQCRRPVLHCPQSGTQMFSSCRPLTRMQEQNVNKLAGVAACLLLRCTTAHDLLELNVPRNAHCCTSWA